jgi:GGDEF domain-containing protein
MASDNTILFLGAGRTESSDCAERLAAARGLVLDRVERAEDVLARLDRSLPACVLLDGDGEATDVVGLVRHLKEDPFTSIVPVVVLLSGSEDTSGVDLFSAGVDELLRAQLSEEERRVRFEQVLRRVDRDVSVHPTTLLPGTNHIARDMQDRLDQGQRFAVCYADLDHFKEFNDRYGYALGDGVILLLSKILRDVVRGVASGGFVGHIGGDDFVFNLPVEYIEPACDLIIQLFDELIPYQYSEEDRKAGYFPGKDRRGNIHRVPIMALSIGVVTNQFQEFEHTGQISELAAEMKGYAKSLPGSKYVVDIRHPAPTASVGDKGGLAGFQSPGPRTEITS